MRTEEQLEAVAELSDREIQQLRKFEALPEDTVGTDGICKHSCYTNGTDTCMDLGITEDAGFGYSEISNASARFAVRTASLFELI
jgi:hypothetical protein